MRLIIYSMLGLLILIQYPLWFEAQQDKNAALEIRNNKLAGDVKDLKEGKLAIEERARTEHGMIKEGEYFVQIVPKDNSGPSTTTPPPNPKQ
jgi:cell division protein FtsB